MILVNKPRDFPRIVERSRKFEYFKKIPIFVDFSLKIVVSDIREFFAKRKI